MYHNNSVSTITNCLFDSNIGGFYGGALRNTENSNVTVEDCVFTNNTSYYGTVFNLSSVADFTRCRITGSTGNYGAISSSGPGGINISDSVFLNNATSVWTGAAMTAQGPGTYIVTDTLFAGNVAANDGGAIRSNVQQLSLINCVFSGNSAAADGGALSLDGNPNGAQTTISNCTFAGHTANLGRAIAMETPSPSFTLELIVANSIFWNGGSEIWEDGSIGVDTTITYSNIEGGCAPESKRYPACRNRRTLGFTSSSTTTTR